MNRKKWSQKVDKYSERASLETVVRYCCFLEPREGKIMPPNSLIPALHHRRLCPYLVRTSKISCKLFGAFNLVRLPSSFKGELPVKLISHGSKIEARPCSSSCSVVYFLDHMVTRLGLWLPNTSSLQLLGLQTA